MNIIQSKQYDFKYNDNAHIGKFWINDEFSFLKIPKNSSTTILEEFNLEDSDLKYNQMADRKLFTIIRNPIERFVSAFLEVLEPSEEYPNGRYKYVSIPYIYLIEIEEIFKLPVIDRMNTYIEFIGNNGFIELHCTPQVQYIYDINGHYIELEMFRNYDIINVESDLYKFLGITSSLDNHNVTNSVTNKKLLLEYINNNDDVKERICEIYQEDIKLYESIK